MFKVVISDKKMMIYLSRAKLLAKNRMLVNELSETKCAYLSILAGLKLNSFETEKYEVFFEDMISEYGKFTSGKVENIDIFNFYRKYCEVAKIKNIVIIAGEMEDREARVKKPIALFLDTIIGAEAFASAPNHLQIIKQQQILS